MRYVLAGKMGFAALNKYSLKHLALLVFAVVFLFSTYAAFFPALASATPTNQADCEAQGGTWISPNHDTTYVCSNAKGLAYAHKDDPSWLAESYWRYGAIAHCLEKSVSFQPAISNDQAAQGAILYNNVGSPDTYGFFAQGVVSDIGDDGKMDCPAPSQSSELTVSSFSFWGVDGLDLICSTGIYTRMENADCRTGTQYGFILNNDARMAGNRANLIKSYLLDAVYGSGAGAPQLSNASSYIFYRSTFEKGCASGVQSTTTDPGGDRTVSIGYIDGAGSSAKISTLYYVLPDNKIDSSIYTFPDGGKLSCKDLAGKLGPGGAYAKAYLAYVKAGGANNGGEGSQGCQDASNCATTGEPVCSAGPLGWVICPLSSLASEITKVLATQIENFLIFQPLSAPGSSQGVAIKKIWNVIIGLANITLAIAFLVVIFSQATSIGLSSYGIKKMLPKIIAAAILMNLSFYICAIAVDISNIAGQAVKGIIEGGIKALPAASSVASNLREGSSSFGIAVTALIGAIGLGALTYTGAIWGIIPMVATATVTMFVAFLSLLLRNILIILLIIVSPLAFAAMILPGTSKWFTRWRELFTALLILFPVIMGLLYGGLFVANVMMLTLDPNAPRPTRVFTEAGALLATAAGIYVVPKTIEKLLGAAANFLGFLNNPNKGLIDRSRNFADRKKKQTGANNAARLANANWGVQRDAEGNIIKDAKGHAIKKKGWRGSLARRASSGANFVGGYGARRDRKNAWQEENAKRIQDEQIFERLAETDKEGNPTGRAQRYATAAAGAGGAKNAERIRRLALEQKKHELMEDVKRETSAMTSAGAMSQGAYYFERTKDGQVYQYSDHGRAMAAVARGDSEVGVVKVGEERTAENAWKNKITGNTYEKRLAAMQRMTSIGDGAAIGYALYGAQGPAIVDAQGNAVLDAQGNPTYEKIQALKDSQIDDFNQFVGDSAGSIAPKLSHLVTNDNGLNGVNGAALANWHGNEFKAAASRIRMLREQGDNGAADKIQEAVEKAYETLSTDANLKQQFKQKHVSAMDDFNKIITGQRARVILREYGDKTTDDNGRLLAHVDPSTGTMRNTGQGLSTARVSPLNGNATSMGFHL